MRALREFFQKSFGVPLLPTLVPGEQELFCLTRDNLLYGSAAALERQYLKQMDIRDFIASDEKGYFLLGYWGHGINSYAFYYSRIDEWSHILFRLGYGGVYGDEEKDAKRVREFLTNYFAFEPELKSKVKSMVAIDSMGDGEYKITKPDGSLIRLDESLYHNPDFRGKFSHLLQR